MNETTYQLKHPIEIRDKETGAVSETITNVTLTRPKGKHLKAMDKAQGEVAQTLALIAAIANQPPTVMDLLDAEDFTELGELVSGFFGGRRPTGKTSTAT